MILSAVTNASLQKLVQDIIAYIRFLRNDYEVCVSLDKFDRHFAPFIVDIRPYCFHNCSYCNYIRQLNPEIRAFCGTRKIQLYGKLGTEPFFGTCWLGVGEYVFPVTDRAGTGIGFISLTGYLGDPEKTRAQTEKIARRYHLDPDAIRAMQTTLRGDPPPMARVRTLLMPLSYMITLMHSYLEYCMLPSRMSITANRRCSTRSSCFSTTTSTPITGGPRSRSNFRFRRAP